MQKTIFIILLSILIFSGCKNDTYKAKDMPEGIGQYIYAYTSGTISKAAEIKIQFAQIVSEQQKATLGENLLKIKPSVSGKSFWRDNQTLVFQPEQHLKSNQNYVGSIDLSSLYSNVPTELRTFEFDFSTYPQNLMVTIQGTESATADLKNQNVKGIVTTTDVVETAKLEKVLTAKQGSKKLKVRWIHQPENNKSFFTVLNAVRSNKSSSVNIVWNGKEINSKSSDSRTVEIPALGDFKVVNIRAVQGEKPHFIMTFSDPLKEGQELKGLIRILNDNRKLSFEISGNEVRIYPQGRVTGEVELVAESGIINSNGARMKSVSNWKVAVEQNKPSVRLVGSGVIMPSSSNLIFPFEAISLNAVEVEVFQIFDDNILQFLQINQLSGSYQMERVGRVILQKKIPLSTINKKANPNVWTRYALDLNDLFNQSPNSIYQIRIGFRQEYSTYVCENKKESDNELTLMEDQLNEEGEIKSFWNGRFGFGGRYDGYEWNHREDPCYPAFYTSKNFVRRNVVSSNLGVTVKIGGEKEVFVAVNDLRSTDKIAGAEVKFYDYQQQLLATRTTDGDGILKTKLDRKPYTVVVNNGADRGFMNLQDGNTLSLSKFDVSGQTVQKGLKGYIYGERGVWRPGDTLFLNFMLEDETGKLPKNHPITFELTDARGQLQKKEVISENINQIYSLKTATSADAPTGDWLAKVTIGGATFAKNLKIETVKPNRLKVNLDFNKEELQPTDNQLDGQLQVNWLHGAPAKNLKAKVEMNISKLNTSFKKYPDYHFEDPARKFNASQKVVFDGNLNESGQARITGNIVSTKYLPGKIKVGFRTRAFEKGGDFSTDNFSIPYSPFVSYSGVSLPKNKWGHERLEANKNGTFEFASVDGNGKPKQGRKLNVGIYRVTWNWWYAGSRNAYKFNSTDHYNALKKQTITTDAKGKGLWTTQLKETGRYLIRVCDNESGHCAGRYFYNGYPWYQNDDNNSARKEASMLTFASDKEVYQVGESASITVPAGDNGKILLTLEDGTKVIDSYWKEADSGENKLSFRITKDMLPTVYAHVSMFQPHSQTKNDLPIRLYGVIPIKVEDKSTELKPTIKMPDVLEPNQTVDITVAESTGKGMAYTIAMVDDGLLDLTRFKTPNPHGSFYAREALGVQTWDVYDDVLGAFGGELDRILAVGGGAAEIDNSKQKANRFKPVVRHLGPFYLEKGQTKKHKIKLPNYVGSVRTMVVARQGDAFGNAEKTTPVRKPLMLLATLPRVLSPGEKLRLPVNVFAMEKKVKDVSVKFSESTGLINLVGNSIQKMKFSSPGDELAYYDIEVSDKVGIAKFDLQATGNGEKASQQIEIEIRNPNPYQSRSYTEIIQPGESKNIPFEPVGIKGTNSGSFEISGIPTINLERRLKYLIRYPYGCLEQTTSAAFPQLYVHRFIEIDANKRREIDQNINAAIERLRNFQNSDGSFSYWPGGDYYNGWSMAYAGHFLVEAKDLGYAIPAGMIENWVRSQKKAIETWNPDYERIVYSYSRWNNKRNQMLQAYRLYTLAKAGKPLLGAMNRLRNQNKLSDKARWHLAGAFALAGKNEVATQLIDELKYNVKPYRYSSGNFGSSDRFRAIVLETMILTGKKNEAKDLLIAVCKNLGSKKWMNTQEIAYSLMAVGKFIGKSQPDEQLSIAYQLGTQQEINAGTKLPLYQKEIDVENLGTKKVTIKNTGSQAIFATFSLEGQPITGLEKPESSKLDIAVEYKSTNGNPIDPKRIAQGTDFYAAVTVTHNGILNYGIEELALEQVFPAGWEIINTRMSDVDNKYKNSDSKYQDFRDDRVHTFFDLNRKRSVTYYVLLNAAYQGKYYLPSVNCEAMYDNTIYARTAGQWIEIEGPENL